MSVIVKIFISLFIGAVAATIISVVLSGNMLQPAVLIGCMLACLCSGLVGSIGANTNDEFHEADAHRERAPRQSKKSKPPKQVDAAVAMDGEREHGEVKWFNVSKGFGFIVRENGEEIFVHFRSIRGTGRRGLRDGQAVSYIVVESDKGPQAEDVSPQ